MQILALNPYHGGSHQAFLDGWIAHSRHEFDVLTLPAYKWKWRMRHAPVTFADALSAPDRTTQSWDALFCTDMLNLAEFRGMCNERVWRLPSAVYFHENQLTYPNRDSSERDLHFAFTNITTCLAADAVWFNSSFHREAYSTAVTDWMRKMPDYPLVHAAEQILAKASVHSPGIETHTPRSTRRPGPLRILWVSRWEYDKDPDTFFEALNVLQQQGVDFRITVLGESYGKVPGCFAKAQERFSEQIDHWGYVASHAEYVTKLNEADVVVSTAIHEFFGIAIVEAVAAGCFPLVPRQLAYPEVLGNDDDFFHDATAQGIARCLKTLGQRVVNSATCWSDGGGSAEIASRYAWPNVADRLDRAIECCRNDVMSRR
ncbi:MAG: DUF3524 domain-containing protein [Planctomycetes bacterium]|nr:DUF3524 domain-containing protein [Planctomycetota bacterium]